MLKLNATALIGYKFFIIKKFIKLGWIHRLGKNFKVNQNRIKNGKIKKISRLSNRLMSKLSLSKGIRICIGKNI